MDNYLPHAQLSIATPLHDTVSCPHIEDTLFDWPTQKIPKRKRYQSVEDIKARITGHPHDQTSA
jgi:hypothetical protein